jgi:hypothetical protein
MLYTPLQYSIILGERTDVVRVLLEHGADPNSMGGRFEMPHRVSRGGFSEGGTHRCTESPSFLVCKHFKANRDVLVDLVEAGGQVPPFLLPGAVAASEEDYDEELDFFESIQDKEPAKVKADLKTLVNYGLHARELRRHNERHAHGSARGDEAADVPAIERSLFTYDLAVQFYDAVALLPAAQPLSLSSASKDCPFLPRTFHAHKKKTLFSLKSLIDRKASTAKGNDGVTPATSTAASAEASPSSPSPAFISEEQEYQDRRSLFCEDEYHHTVLSLHLQKLRAVDEAFPRAFPSPTRPTHSPM